ncbi:unnamed protein product, partial [Allacma fusca]
SFDQPQVDAVRAECDDPDAVQVPNVRCTGGSQMMPSGCSTNPGGVFVPGSDVRNCMPVAGEPTIYDCVTTREVSGASGGRRRRRIESFTGGRSRTPSGFRREPIKRSSGPRNLPGQGRAPQRK